VLPVLYCSNIEVCNVLYILVGVKVTYVRSSIHHFGAIIAINRITMRFHPLFFGITGAAAFTAPIPRFSVSTCGSRTIPGLPVSLSEEVTAPSTDEVPAPSNEPEASLENSGDEALQPNDKDTGAEEASMGERKRIITRDRNTAYVGNLSTGTS